MYNKAWRHESESVKIINLDSDAFLISSRAVMIAHISAVKIDGNDSLFCTRTCGTCFSSFHCGHSLQYTQWLPLQLRQTSSTYLVVMVKLTTTSACNFSSTVILSMSKALAFKAMQEIRNKRFNTYVKIACFGSLGKSLDVKCKDDGIRW